jgi:OFA family oxalate/formate antiporter-like MFS transporter
MKRWIVALSGIMVVMGPGAIYSYSLFTQPLIASFGWSATTTTWAFALANFFIGLGAVIGGFWADRKGPRAVALLGTTLWGLGNILTGTTVIGHGVEWLYLSYGIIGGLGCGMAYIAAVSTVLRWFPRAPGFGGGIVLVGFGLGAFVYNMLLRGWSGYAAIAAQSQAYAAARAQALADQVPFVHANYALSPDLVSQLMSVFVTSGVVFLVVGAIFALLLEAPPAGDPAYLPLGLQVSTAEMLMTPQFYLLWTMLFINVTAGVIIISNAVPIMSELTSQSVGVVTGWYIFLSLFNGLGRIFWGALSDHIGRRLIFGIQVIVFFTLGALHDLVTVSVSFAVVLFCYGGGFGSMPAFCSDYFGTKHFGLNYGITLTAWGFAGLFGPSFVSTIKDLTGSYGAALQPIGIMLLVAIVFPLISEQVNRRLTHGSAAQPAVPASVGRR